MSEPTATPAAAEPTPATNEGGFIDSLDAYFNNPTGPEPTPVAPEPVVAPEPAAEPTTTEPADDIDSI